jgi:hypothetical protein
MRILVLVHEFPPVGGGGGRVAEDICGKLAKREHEVNVLTAHVKGLPGQFPFHGAICPRGTLGRAPFNR